MNGSDRQTDQGQQMSGKEGDEDTQHDGDDTGLEQLHPASESSSPVSDRDAFSIDDEDDQELPPPVLSSPSAVSSVESLRLELSRTTLNDDGLPPAATRLALAKRLSHLAKQLSDVEDIDDTALATQIDSLEKVIEKGQPGQQFSPPNRHWDAGRTRTRDSQSANSFTSSPTDFRHRLSDLSLSFSPESKPRSQEAGDDKASLRADITKRQARRIIVEAAKLNDELTSVVENLRARQEEADHIHALLIERAERAAQRIIFLQSRIAYLEEELQENDDELQHLRICLKAVEVQLPPHPDKELQRCIAAYKEDYKELKRKRAGARASLGTGDEVTGSSPAR